VSLALGAPTPSAEAHGVLVQSRPEGGAVLASAPAEVLLWFNEEIEINFSRAQLINVKGERFDTDDFHIHKDPSNPGLTTLYDKMPDGTYTLVWDVLSAIDGHRTKGAFAFFVGPPGEAPAPGSQIPTPDLGAGSGPPDWLDAVTRWFNFAGMAALIGATLFPFLVLGRGFAGLSRTTEGGVESPNADGEEVAARALRAAVIVSIIALLVAALASVWLQVWSAGGSLTMTGVLSDVIFDSRFGETWIARAGIVALAAACAVMLPRRDSRPWEQSILHRTNTRWLLLVALAVALPATTSLGSHAAANSGSPVAPLVDWVHLVAGGVWVGGLVQLVIVVLAVLPRLEDRSVFLGPLIRRFSLIAAVSVAVIVGTGVLQSIERLGGLGELVDSTYGSTLLVKVLVLLPLLAFGAFNLLVSGPRFVSLARGGAARAASGLSEKRFRFAVSAELLLATGVLAATAVLTITPPPAPAAGSDASLFASPDIEVKTAEADDLSVAVWADPGRVGLNDVSVLLRDLDGDERMVQRVILRLKYLGESIGVDEVDATVLHPPSHFVAKTSAFSLPGQWEVEVIVRREGLRDTRTTVSFEVAG